MSKKQFFLVAIIMLAFSACKNPDSVVGLNIQPPADKLGLSIDTITLQSITLKEDTLRADKVLNLVGSDYSAVFGKTNCSVYSQVVWGNTPAIPTGTTLLDSLILKLAYSTPAYYGDTNTALTIHVYQLTDSMNVDSPYYNNTAFAYATELATMTFKPQPTTAFTEFGNAVVPQLRIPLPQLLGQNILSQNGQAPLLSSSAWITYFQGIYIKVDQVNTVGKGCICYFDMGALDSKMTIYFTPPNDTIQYYDFQLTGARSNYQTHDYSGTVVAAQLANSNIGNGVNYIQGAAGLKMKIQMPYINQYAGTKSIAINRAELIINHVPTPLDTLSPPPALWLQTIDSTGAEAYIPDQFEGNGFYGGTYNTATGQYIFNMTHYIQDIVKGTVTDHGLFLGVSGASVLEYYGVIAANRVTIASAQNTNPALKMTLKLYYTKLN